MKRLAVPLMIAGSLAVLAALFVLLRAVTSESSTAPVTSESPIAPVTTQPGPTQVAQDPWAPSPSAPSTPSTPSKAPAHGEQLPSLPNLPGLSSDKGSDTEGNGPPGTRLNTKNLHYGLDQLIVKIAENTPQVTACMGGKKPSAKVSLQFIVAEKAGKYLVEQVDIDADQTTLEDQALLDCMMNATKKIQLEGLPREAPAIIVTRVTTFSDGAVTEDKPLKFSYLR